MAGTATSRAQLEGLSLSELHDLARELSWVHRIDLGEEYVTDGLWGTGNPEIEAALADIDFTGTRVLDIGCWDGRYSFEAEERGAREVFATDLATQRDYTTHPTLEVARAARRSQIHYVPDLSVYDVGRLGVQDFNVVIFAGVYYHLKDPLLALAALRRVMRTGGTILVEGAVNEKEGCFADFYYAEPYAGDHSNWWVPTVECLRQWVRCSGFEIVKEYGAWGAPQNPRHALLARATEGRDEHYRWEDEHLGSIVEPSGS